MESLRRGRGDRSASRDRRVRPSCAGRSRTPRSESPDHRERRTQNALPQIRLVPGARDMRLRERDADRLDFPAVATKLTGAGVPGERVVDMLGEKFGGGVAALELGNLVEV